MGIKQNSKWLLLENNTFPFILLFAVLVSYIYCGERDFPDPKRGWGRSNELGKKKREPKQVMCENKERHKNISDGM